MKKGWRIYYLAKRKRTTLSGYLNLKGLQKKMREGLQRLEELRREKELGDLLWQGDQKKMQRKEAQLAQVIPMSSKGLYSAKYKEDVWSLVWRA